MPSRKPAARDARGTAEPAVSGSTQDDARPAVRRRVFSRADLPPSGAVGVLMGLAAAQEGSGAPVAVVVAVVGCAVVLGLLALKRGLYGP